MADEPHIYTPEELSPSFPTTVDDAGVTTRVPGPPAPTSASKNEVQTATEYYTRMAQIYGQVALQQGQEGARLNTPAGRTQFMQDQAQRVLDLQGPAKPQVGTYGQPGYQEGFTPVPATAKELETAWRNQAAAVAKQEADALKGAADARKAVDAIRAGASPAAVAHAMAQTNSSIIATNAGILQQQQIMTNPGGLTNVQLAQNEVERAKDNLSRAQQGINVNEFNSENQFKAYDRMVNQSVNEYNAAEAQLKHAMDTDQAALKSMTDQMDTLQRGATTRYTTDYTNEVTQRDSDQNAAVSMANIAGQMAGHMLPFMQPRAQLEGIYGPGGILAGKAPGVDFMNGPSNGPSYHDLWNAPQNAYQQHAGVPGAMPHAQAPDWQNYNPGSVNPWDVLGTSTPQAMQDIANRQALGQRSVGPPPATQITAPNLPGIAPLPPPLPPPPGLQQPVTQEQMAQAMAAMGYGGGYTAPPPEGSY